MSWSKEEIKNRVDTFHNFIKWTVLETHDEFAELINNTYIRSNHTELVFGSAFQNTPLRRAAQNSRSNFQNALKINQNKDRLKLPASYNPNDLLILPENISIIRPSSSTRAKPPRTMSAPPSKADHRAYHKPMPVIPLNFDGQGNMCQIISFVENEKNVQGLTVTAMSVLMPIPDPQDFGEFKARISDDAYSLIIEHPSVPQNATQKKAFTTAMDKSDANRQCKARNNGFKKILAAASRNNTKTFKFEATLGGFSVHNRLFNNEVAHLSMNHLQARKVGNPYSDEVICGIPGCNSIDVYAKWTMAVQQTDEALNGRDIEKEVAFCERSMMEILNLKNAKDSDEEDEDYGAF